MLCWLRYTRNVCWDKSSLVWEGALPPCPPQRGTFPVTTVLASFLVYWDMISRRLQLKGERAYSASKWDVKSGRNLKKLVSHHIHSQEERAKNAGCCPVPSLCLHSRESQPGYSVTHRGWVFPQQLMNQGSPSQAISQTCLKAHIPGDSRFCQVSH